VEFGKDTEVYIYDAADLCAVATNVNNGTEKYKGKTLYLMNDLDLTDCGWVSIGGTRAYFQGTFDGQGYTVYLDPTATGTYGSTLFAFAEYATIRNVVTDVKDPNTTSIGAPILYYGEQETIEYCINYANVGCDKVLAIGGIAYDNHGGTIRDCINYGDVRGLYHRVIQNEDPYPGYSAEAGGICYSTGSLIRCANYGNVYAGSSYSSALGYATKLIEQCVNYGNFERGGGGNQYRNALIMCSPDEATIQDSYNTGSLTVVGLDDKSQQNSVAAIWGSSTNCYNTGSLSHTISDDKATMGKGVPTADFLDKTNSDLVAIQVNARLFTITNCYSKTAVSGMTAQELCDKLNDGRTGDEAPFEVRGTKVALKWEPESGSSSYTVTIQTDPEDADVRLYSDSACTQSVSWTNGGALSTGTYYYQVSKAGYETKTGTVVVSAKDVTVSVSLDAVATVQFRIKPSNATFTLSGSSGTVESSSTTSSGDYTVYTFDALYVGQTYSYNVSGPTDDPTVSYTSVGREYTVTSGGGTVTVELEKKNKTGQTVYGDGNVGADLITVIDDTNTTAGQETVFEIGEGATGTLTISTTNPVTLMGGGTSSSAVYSKLYINCTEPGTNLTLQDVYIDVTGSGDADSSVKSILDFTGTKNTLTFSGTNILDMNTNATYYAAIHVGKGTELTITGGANGGTAYIYKYEMAAAIGGGNGDKNGESNGTIGIENATLFIKGSKQGALIGPTSGATCDGNISIENSELNMISNARGAAIGGSAGGSGASSGGTVSITGSRVNINVDFTGAAIGGGGYASGNDSSGGKLILSNSSVRTYVDENAVNSWGLTQAGVSSNVITASVQNRSGTALYLLTFDTTMLNQSASTFNVQDESGSSVYNGGLHRWTYINEDTTKLGQVSVSYTISNWVASNDPCLYLYLPGVSQTITVNNQKFAVTWNGSSQSLSVAPVQTKAAATTEIVDRVAVTTVDSEGLTAALAGMSANEQLVIAANVPTGTSIIGAQTDLSQDDVAQLVNAGVSLNASSTVAEIELSPTALKSLAALGGDKVVLSATNGADGVKIDLTVDGKSVSTLTGGLRVTLPVVGKTDSTILVQVNADGTQTTLKDAVFSTDGKSVSITVDGPCTLKVTQKAKAVLATTTVEKGVATTTIDSETLLETLKNASADEQLVIEAEIPDGTFFYSTVTALTEDDVWNIVYFGNSLKVSSTLADITLTNAALYSVAQLGGQEITITASDEGGNATSIEVAVDGDPVGSVTGGLLVTLPVDADSITAKTILVLVDKDGKETELTDATFGSDSVTVWVDGSCTLKITEREEVVVSKTEIKDGVATTTIDSEALAEQLAGIISGDELVIKAEIPEGETVTETRTVLIQEDLKAIAQADVSLKLTSPLAEITLPASAVLNLADQLGKEITITASKTENGTKIELAVDDKVMETVSGGLKVSLPVETAAAGTVLMLVDDDGNTTVIKKSVLDGDTVTALLTGSCTIKAVDNTKTFADVGDAWYTDAVAFASSHGLFNGIGNDQFDPEGKMTRSMLVTVLYRLENEPSVFTSSSFSDVADSWYTDAVAWANANKIVEGDGNGSFAPDDYITREQMATILYRYMDYLGLDVSLGGDGEMKELGTDGVLARYADAGNTSTWANAPMQWAVISGIITGQGTGDDLLLNPSGLAQRAEVATMLQRLINLMLK
jgi:hypothetical protein